MENVIDCNIVFKKIIGVRVTLILVVNHLLPMVIIYSLFGSFYKLLILL